MPVSAFTAEIRAQESPRGSCIGRMQHNICGADIICLIVYFYKRNEVQIMRTVGTVSRGVRCPVVKEGDDLIRIVTEAIADMGKEEHILSLIHI